MSNSFHFYNYDPVLLSRDFDKEKKLVMTFSILGYTPLENQIQYPFHSPAISAEFASYLLESNDSEKHEIAKNVLTEILKYQIMDPTSDYFGFFRLSPLHEVEGTEIFYDHTTRLQAFAFIQILMNHRNKIPYSLASALEKSVHAIMFYINNLENRISHIQSNETISTAILLMLYGVFSKKEEQFNFGVKHLESYYYAICHNGNFWEYNSPASYTHCSHQLNYIMTGFNSPHCAKMANELNYMIWKNILNTYHAPTGIITGPYTNSHNEPLVISDFYFKFCPEDLKKQFSNNQDNFRFSRQSVSKGSTSINFFISQSASNYLQPEYAFGTLSRELFWDHHCPFVGYIRSKEDDNHYSFKIYTWNNGHKYSSGEINCVQEEGFAIGHIFFVTNRGDTHTIFDNTEGKIVTSDFRLRFEIKGNIQNLNIETEGNELSVSYGDTKLFYKIPYAVFGDIPIKFELTKTDSVMYFDAVLDISEKTEINFKALESAIFQFVFHISASGKQPGKITNSIENGILTTNSVYNNLSLTVKSPCKPDYFEYLSIHSGSYINNITLEHYIVITEMDNIKYKSFPDTDNSITMFDINNNFPEDIKQIDTVPFEDLQSCIKSITDNLIKKNYNTEIYKQYVIYIISKVFEKAKSGSPEFKKIIDIHYSDTFRKISLLTSNTDITDLLLVTISHIEKDYINITSTSGKNALVSHVVTVIEENYKNPFLSLSMISELTGFNEKYISREFKNKTNTNYLEYLTRIRMEKAKKLLLTTDDLEYILKECGYLDVSSFRRRFRNYTGMTITEWLNQNRQ